MEFRGSAVWLSITENVDINHDALAKLGRICYTTCLCKSHVRIFPTPKYN